MRLLAALLVLVPCSVLSQVPEQHSDHSTSDAAEWAISGGLFSGASYTFNISMMDAAWAPTPPQLGAAVWLEKRLSPGTWLTAGFLGAASRQRQDVPPGYIGVAEWNALRATLTGGVRKVVTGESAPVALSVLALATAGGASADAEVRGSTIGWASTTNWRVGATLGIAVDRELTPGLSLRLATPVFDVAWVRSRSKTLGGYDLVASGVEASVAPTPRLELRLAF